MSQAHKMTLLTGVYVKHKYDSLYCIYLKSRSCNEKRGRYGEGQGELYLAYLIKLLCIWCLGTALDVARVRPP